MDHRPERHLMSKTVPLKLFGDGIAVLGVSKSWGRSVLTFLLTPLITTSCSRGSQILLCVLWKNKLTAAGFDKFWKNLAWCLESLASGTWPSCDMWGNAYEPGSEAWIRSKRPLAGGMRAKIVSLTGDLEFIAQGYELNSPQSLQPCSKCICNGDTIPWTDTKPGPDTSSKIMLGFWIL